jgi:cytochrome c oxidase subunit 3
MPAGLWWSTGALVASSIALEAAHRAVQRERQTAFRLLLAVALGLALAFVMLQVPALGAYLQAQRHAQEAAAGAGELGAGWDPDHARQSEINAGPREGQIHMTAFTLVVLHGLHVLGGLLPMALVTARAWQGRYDHEWHRGVTACAWYWHFLDVVWLLLLATFVFAA